MELTTLLLLLLAAFVVATLVVASGFGLGTTLTPLFLVAYDIKTAVLLVAVVHLTNNLFKLYLFRGNIDYAVVRRGCCATANPPAKVAASRGIERASLQ